jgi:hypothetical protein
MSTETKKMTAVEWLLQQLYKEGHFKTSVSFPDVAQLECVAKAMEKEQIMDAFTNEDNIQWDRQIRRKAADQYYNETFGGDK